MFYVETPEYSGPVAPVKYIGDTPEGQVYVVQYGRNGTFGKFLLPEMEPVISAQDIIEAKARIIERIKNELK